MLNVILTFMMDSVVVNIMEEGKVVVETPRSAKSAAKRVMEASKPTSRNSQRNEKSAGHSSKRSGNDSRTAKSSPSRSAKRSAKVSKSAKKSENADKTPTGVSRAESEVNLADGDPTAGTGMYLSTGVEGEGTSMDAIDSVLHANTLSDILKAKLLAKESHEEDDGWDTDLEETKPKPKVKKDPYARRAGSDSERARIVYQKACTKFHITPSSSFLRGLKSGYVNLSNQGLGPEGAHAVALGLVVDSHVKEVSVSHNNIGNTGIKSLMDMLKDNDRISRMDVSENNLQSFGAQAIGSMLMENDTLLSLKAKGNNFCEMDAQWFANALHSYRSNLRELDLSHNNLGPVGGQLLGQALASNDSLETLNLSWNNLRKRGIKAIALGLAENTSLRKLNVAWNGIGDDGAVYLADAITASDSVEKLNLNSNRISIEGVSRVILSFAPNKTLTRLKLSGNPVTVDGPVVALKLIRAHPEIGLQVLEFKDLCMTSEISKIIERILKRKPNFELKHAGFTNGQDDLNAAIKKREKDILNDPFVFLINYVRDHKLRWRDLFNRLDTDKNFSISGDEFRDGMKKAGIPMTRGQVDTLIERLDADQNGEIDFGELLEGQTKYIKRLERILGDANAQKSAQGSRPESRQESRPASRMEVVLENTLKLQSNRVHNPNPRFEGELEDIKMSFHVPTVHMKSSVVTQ